MLTNRAQWALIFFTLVASPAHAQLVFFDGGRFSADFTRVSRRGAFSISVGGFPAANYGFWPVRGPRWGYGPRISYLSVYAPPPPLVIVVPVGVPEPRTVEVIRREPELVPEPPLPGRNAGRFRPLEPDNRARAEQPVKQDVPEVPKRNAVEVPPLLPKPNILPGADTLVEKGRIAFAAGEFGRALDFFVRGAKVAPRDAEVLYLLSQAYLALGKYADSVDAVRRGMTRRRDWPLAKFQPWELYGQNVDGYADNVQRLLDTLARHADDPTLLFLLGHQLWFEGREAEARLYLQRARQRFVEPELIDRFLNGVADSPVAIASF